MTRRKIAGLATAVAATAALTLPGVAAAGTVPMRGVVSGSPYGASNGQMAIPVLFSRITARDAGLKSPVGVIIVKRTQKVQLPNGAGTTIPVNLRTGDRFKGTGTIGGLQQKVFYPRVVFGKTVVYFRSKELSLAELSLAVDSLRKSLDGLGVQVAGMRAFALQQLGQLAAQLTALQHQLGDLSDAHNALSKAVNDLNGRVGDLELGLAKQVSDLQKALDRISAIEGNIGTTDVKKLRTDLDGLIAGLTAYAKLTDLPDLSGYALKTDIPVLSGVDLTNYAKLTDLPDLSQYVKLSDLPDFSTFAKLTDLPDFTQFVKLSDLPDFSQFLTAADLLGYAKLTDIPDLSSYAKLSDLPDLTPYAKLTDLPDLSPYAKTADVTAAITGATSTLASQASVTATNQRIDVVCNALKQLDPTHTLLTNVTVPGFTTACP